MQNDSSFQTISEKADTSNDSAAFSIEVSTSETNGYITYLQTKLMPQLEEITERVNRLRKLNFPKNEDIEKLKKAQ